MGRKLLMTLLVASVLVAGLAACAPASQEPSDDVVKVGPVELNAHPASLEGKTVVLRWNGKPNGDKLLTRVGERLSEQFPGVKLVKLWEVDESTAVSSDDAEVSLKIAETIAAQNPDLVIGSQCD
jgi:ABC-type Fe3+-hydroxamate transport system substrate-binding protein